MKPDIVINYLVSTGTLTAASGKPFDYVEFKRTVTNDVESFEITKWLFPQAQMTIAQLATIEASPEFAAWLTEQPKIDSRKEARNFIDNGGRRFALIVMDEINLPRQFIKEFKVVVAAAASLADLKTRVAAIMTSENFNPRTIDQLKAAMDTKD